MSKYPSDPPIVNKKPATGPLRVEHRLCGYVTLLRRETRRALKRPETAVFCAGCAKMLPGTDFQIMDEEPR